MKRTLIILALSIALLATPLSAATDADEYPYENEDETPVGDAVEFLKTHQASDGSIGGHAVSGWVAISAVHAGEDPDEWRTNGDAPSLVDYLVDEGADRYEDEDTFVPGENSTDWSRQLLALETAGEDVAEAGGVDYVEGLLSTFDGTQFGHEDLMGDDYWGVIALGATLEEDPDPELEEAIEETAEWIEENQYADGGWSWTSLYATDPIFITFSPSSDIDSTSSALNALITAERTTDYEVDEITLERGYEFMQTHQRDDGGCGSNVVFDVAFGMSLDGNVASTSWAVTAIEAADEDPKSAEWSHPATGEDLVDFLVDAQLDEGGFPSPTSSGSDVWNTAYAITALTGSTYATTE